MRSFGDNFSDGSRRAHPLGSPCRLIIPKMRRLNTSPGLGDKVRESLREFLECRYGSVPKAAAALGWGRPLEDYLYGESTFDYHVFLDVVEKTGFLVDSSLSPRSHFSPTGLSPRCLTLLGAIPIPERPEQTLLSVKKLVLQVKRRLQKDNVPLGKLTAEAFATGFATLTLETKPYAALKRLEKEWHRLRKRTFRRRRPGGMMMTEEAVGDLAQFLLMHAAVELKIERFEYAAEYLRCFFSIPFDIGSLQLYGRMTLVKLLRSFDPEAALWISRNSFSLVVETGDEALLSFSSLLYASILADLEDYKASRHILRFIPFEENSVWSWYGALALSTNLETSGRWQDSLEVLSRIDVPKKIPHLRYRVFWHIGSVYLRMGNKPAARAYLHDSLDLCPISVDGFKRIRLLVELLRAGERHHVVFALLRRMKSSILCKDKKAAPNLQEALSLLQEELQRSNSSEIAEVTLTTISSICSRYL